MSERYFERIESDLDRAIERANAAAGVDGATATDGGAPATDDSGANATDGETDGSREE